ncbi:MAG: type IX secretion system membrane protein PorP/SprF, partial [Flavobacteriales bacterium]
MKQVVFILSFIIASMKVGGQQLSQYSFFTYNYMLYNPAVTGTTPCIDMRVGTRRQWTGFTGAPTSNFLYAHSRIGKESKLKIHGLGGVVETDRAGPFNNVGINLNYAFHKKITKGYFMAGGLSLGIYQYSINYAALKFENQLDETAIEGSINTLLFPYANFGLWLYNRNKFFGFSIRSIGNPVISGVLGSNLQRHITFAAGFTKRLSTDLIFKPAFLVNYVAKSKPSIDLQGLLNYRELFDI